MPFKTTHRRIRFACKWWIIWRWEKRNRNRENETRKLQCVSISKLFRSPNSRGKAIRHYYTISRSIVRLSGITFPTTFRDALYSLRLKVNRSARWYEGVSSIVIKLELSPSIIIFLRIFLPFFICFPVFHFQCDRIIVRWFIKIAILDSVPSISGKYPLPCVAWKNISNSREKINCIRLIMSPCAFVRPHFD